MEFNEITTDEIFNFQSNGLIDQGSPPTSSYASKRGS